MASANQSREEHKMGWLSENITVDLLPPKFVWAGAIIL